MALGCMQEADEAVPGVPGVCLVCLPLQWLWAFLGRSEGAGGVDGLLLGSNLQEDISKASGHRLSEEHLCCSLSCQAEVKEICEGTSLAQQSCDGAFMDSLYSAKSTYYELPHSTILASSINGTRRRFVCCDTSKHIFFQAYFT